jgi:hypothetical protein
LLTLTVAFVTRAPDGSETVPERDAVEVSDCARRGETAFKLAKRTSRVIRCFTKHTAFTGPP